MSRFLLFDDECSLCSLMAAEIESGAEDWLEVRSLRDPHMQELLDGADPHWDWGPTLLIVDDHEVQVVRGSDLVQLFRSQFWSSSQSA